MIRLAGMATVVTLAAVSTVNALAGSMSRHGATGPRVLGHGVFVSIDESHIERATATDGLIESRVTLSNQGTTPFRIDYLTFSLCDAAGTRSLALLPSELYGKALSPVLLGEHVLASGESVTAVLYFRSPRFRPVDLRVDLANVDGQVTSRSFVPFAPN